MQKKKEGAAVAGSTYAMQGEILPSWNAKLMNEEPHDGNVFYWAFTQESNIDDTKSEE